MNLNDENFTPRAEVLEALKRAKNEGHPLTCLAYKASISMPATASRFAGLVDRISGDRDKRLAKIEAEYEAYKNERKRQQGEQLDIFGVVS